jgi:hypothetical protein
VFAARRTAKEQVSFGWFGPNYGLNGSTYDYPRAGRGKALELRGKAAVLSGCSVEVVAALVCEGNQGNYGFGAEKGLRSL